MTHRHGCLHPGCERTAYSRGRCPSHYTIACKLVRDGKTTWAELEARGEAAPTNRRAGWNWRRQS